MMEERSGEQGQVSGDTGMIDSADALQLDEARWDAVVATLPPLVRARARNGVRTRAFLEAVLWIAVTRQPWGASRQRGVRGIASTSDSRAGPKAACGTR